MLAAVVGRQEHPVQVWVAVRAFYRFFDLLAERA